MILFSSIIGATAIAPAEVLPPFAAGELGSEHLPPAKGLDPKGQLPQIVAPEALFFPTGHAAQLLAPGELLKVPGEHCKH